MDWMQLFRAGTHTDAAGKVKTWTDQDLAQIAQKYNDSDHEAPIVIGHPKENGPAFGWIKALRVVGDVLEGLPTQVSQAFADLVNRGVYKKRSISLYPDLTLRHVGFLGAMPPAVKGLKDVSFQDDPHSTGAVAEFNFIDPAQGADIMKPYLLLADGRVFDTKAGQLIDPETDTAYQAWTAAGNEPEGDEKEPPEPPPASHSENNPVPVPVPQAIKKSESAGPNFSVPTAREKELEARLALVETQARTDKAQAFTERLIAEGRLVPAQAEGLVEYMAEEEGLRIEFADSNKKDRPLWLRNFLGSLPVQGHLGTLGQGSTAEFAEDDKTAASIAEASGFMNN